MEPLFNGPYKDEIIKGNGRYEVEESEELGGSQSASKLVVNLCSH